MDAAVVGIPVATPQPTQITFEDGLGERRYAIGAAGEPLEVLKLSSVLSSVSSFDVALREGAARLSNFRHDAYSRVRSVELDRRTSALLVSSDYVPGVRLSSLLSDARKRGLPLELNAVRCLVRQLVSAVAALHDAIPDVGNGAIALERLVITPAGRLVIVEYVFGAALEQLKHARARYWRELAVALPEGAATSTFDARTDVMQVGVVALALILGRPLTSDDYPERLTDLVHAATTLSADGTEEPLPVSVRTWLMQALQLDEWDSFASAADARASLDDAFGIEDENEEASALRLFLSRYAATDAPVEDDLAPRLEAMKAFLARYPARRPETPSAETIPSIDPLDEVIDIAFDPEAPALDDFADDPGSVTLIEADDAPYEPDPQVKEERAAPRVEAAPPLSSYAEERRIAAPVSAPNKLGVIAAAVGLLLFAVALTGFFYMRDSMGTGKRVGTLSVGTSPAGIPVFVDDQPHGVTPLGVELPAGEHIVELRTDTERRRIPITVTAGGQVSQYFEFARTGTAAQPTGELQVRTDPIGAGVTVDGKYVGRSPVSVSDLTPGNHTVVMQNESGSQTERVIIENGRTASLVVSMGSAQKAGAAGWIRVEAPAEVQVFENGRLVGASNFERIMLPVGRHELEFVNEAVGYRERRAVQVAAGQASTLRLEWPRGSMAINAIPWAEVFVDGQRVGETPIGNYSTLVGTHEVLFRHPELGERRMSVTVTTAEPLKVGIDLRSK